MTETTFFETKPIVVDAAEAGASLPPAIVEKARYVLDIHKAAFRKAAELSPQDPIPPTNAAVALVQQARIEEAEALLRQELAAAVHRDRPGALGNGDRLAGDRARDSRRVRDLDLAVGGEVQALPLRNGDVRSHGAVQELHRCL
mgnify:CR=1 FL=1